MFDIDSITKLELQNLLNGYFSLPATYARNILIASGKMTYQEPIILPDTCLKSTKRDKYNGVSKSSYSSQLSVYPNPSRYHLTVEYHLAHSPKDGFIALYDIRAVRLKYYSIHKQHDQITIPLDNLKPSNYLIGLYMDGKLIESKKSSLSNKDFRSSREGSF